MNKYFVLAAKATISCVLLGYLFITVDMAAIKSVIGRADWRWVAITFLVLVLGFCLSCYKWQILLKSDDAVCSFGALVRYYLVGFYFNNFLPTSIGGDAVRIFLVSRKCGKKIAGLNSVLAERFSGLLAIIFIGLLGVLLVPAVAGEAGVPLFAGALGVSLLTVWMLLSDGFRRGVKRLIPAKFWRQTEEVLVGIGGYFRAPSTLWTMAWTSLLFQMLIVLVYFLGAKALALTISFPCLMAVVPIVTLLMLLPISLNGLGLREGGFVVLLSGQGVTQSEALSLSLLVYALTLLFSLAGGFLFFIGRNRQ